MLFSCICQVISVDLLVLLFSKTMHRQGTVFQCSGAVGDFIFHMDRNVRENFLPSDWSHDRDA